MCPRILVKLMDTDLISVHQVSFWHDGNTCLLPLNAQFHHSPLILDVAREAAAIVLMDDTFSMILVSLADGGDWKALAFYLGTKTRLILH